jgi:hypothetical protein
MDEELILATATCRNCGQKISLIRWPTRDNWCHTPYEDDPTYPTTIYCEHNAEIVRRHGSTVAAPA